jgi:alpha-methylacyl-CoA racemase
MTGPLVGLRVVEFAAVTPPSIAAMVLAGMGADVVRIDRFDHEADDERNTLRRGRRSIALDLKHPRGHDIARRLVARADVVLEGYRPGVMERLGFGPDELLAEWPHLVYGRLTGWGQTGPNRLMAGHDITYLALTGALYPMGPADGPPVPPLNFVGDLGGGTMLLLVGLLAALHERERSGLGQVVDAAMVDGVPLLAATILRGVAQGTWTDDRGRNFIDGGAPFSRTYTCADEAFLAVGAIEPPFYAQLLEGLGLRAADLPDQWDRDRWPELAGIIAERVLTRTRGEWEEVFTGTDACVAPVLTWAEAARHPHMAERRAFVEQDGHLQPGPAPKLSRTPVGVPRPAPIRGGQTSEILAELGLPADEIAALLHEGVALDPGAVTLPRDEGAGRA